MKKPYPPGPNQMPITPWWHHPNHNYRGRHRGTYQNQDSPTLIRIGSGIQKLILAPMPNNYRNQRMQSKFVTINFPYRNREGLLGGQ